MWCRKEGDVRTITLSSVTNSKNKNGPQMI